MPDTIEVKPAEGRQVRDPGDRNRLLPSEGKRVTRTAYWLRRLAQGDVVEILAATPAKQAKKAKE